MRVLASIILATGLATMVDESGASPSSKIEPIPVWQAQIDRVVRAGSIDLDEYRDVLVLRTMVRQNRHEFIRQAAYYSMQVTTPEADETGQDITEDDVRTRFALAHLVPLMGADMAAARMQLLDHLDTEDPKLKRYLYKTVFRPWVSECTDETHAREFMSYISGYRAERPLAPPPWSVIALLFERKPALGLMEMERIYRQDFKATATPDIERTLAYAAHTVDDVLWRVSWRFDRPGDVQGVISELDKLARMPEWWPRVYVAEVVNRHESLRTPELVERLSQDENELVRKALRRQRRDD